MENTVRPDRHPDRHADRHADHATQTGVVTRMLTHVFGALVRIVMLPPQLVRLAGRALRAGRRAVAPVGRRAGTGVRQRRSCRPARCRRSRSRVRTGRDVGHPVGRARMPFAGRRAGSCRLRRGRRLPQGPCRRCPPLGARTAAPDAAGHAAAAEGGIRRGRVPEPLPSPGRTPDRRHHRHHLDGRRTVSRRRSSGGHPPRLLGLDGPPLVEAAVRPSGDCRRSGCPSGWRVVRGRAG